MLILSDKIKTLCQGATVFLDTNVFICAEENLSLAELIAELTAEYSTTFVTLSSVEYEYSRGSRSLQEIKERREFIRNLVQAVKPVGKLIESDKNDPFSVAMSLTVGRKSSQYTDYLLAVATHAYRNGIDKYYILSTDSRAFPPALFNIVGTVTLNRASQDISHLHLFELDDARYGAFLQKTAED